jgi:hypothetical protein
LRDELALGVEDLNAPARVFGGVNVPLPIDGDAARVFELARADALAADLKD